MNPILLKPNSDQGSQVIVNGKAWGRLDDATKEVITAAAATAEAKCWAKAEELDSWYVEQFTANGMNVGTLNADMQAQFEKVGAELRDAWLERAGEKGKAVVRAAADPALELVTFESCGKAPSAEQLAMRTAWLGDAQ